MKKYLITIFSVLTLISGATAQPKINYVVFQKALTGQNETNLYTVGPVKFDFDTQYLNVKNADVDKDVDRAIKRKDFRFLAIGGQADLFPGMEGHIRNRYIKKDNYKVIAGTKDVIKSGAPPLQTVAYDYARRYNKALVTYVKMHEVK